MSSYFRNHSWVKKNRLRLISERGYVCQRCGVVPKKLDQHHTDGNKDNHEDSNIELLCPKCHGATRIGLSTEHTEDYLLRSTQRNRGSTKFQKVLSNNRANLNKAGYHPSTIHSWEYGKRTPVFETALKLSTILNMPLSDIPYWRVEVNRP